MANNHVTYQQQRTVSINRDKLTDIATDIELSKNDYRVLLMLFTQLNGYAEPEHANRNTKDPMNFKKIDVDVIADTLCMTEKKVVKSIRQLHNDGYIEIGSNDVVKDGWRFTF